MLAAMFSGRHPVSKDQDGRYFIDADPDIFSHILTYLRLEQLPSAALALHVYKAAEHFSIKTLADQLLSYALVVREIYLETNRSRFQDYGRIYNEAVQKIRDGNQVLIIGEIMCPLSGYFSAEGKTMQCPTCTDKTVVHIFTAEKELHQILNMLMLELNRKGFIATLSRNKYWSYSNLKTMYYNHLTIS